MSLGRIYGHRLLSYYREGVRLPEKVIGRLFENRFTVLCIAFGMMAISAVPARANILTSATATANCQGYGLSVNATELTVGVTYTIDYSFTVTCGSSSPVTIPVIRKYSRPLCNILLQAIFMM